MRTLMLLIALIAPFAADAHEGVLVVVVRHAEKATDDPRDPGLAPAGQARAERLAASLAGAGLDRVFSSQYRRTRDTAAPSADAAGLRIEIRPVDAANAATYAGDLARELRALPPGSTALVVGHSNTAPGLVAALSGQPEAPMPESEYDRYTVVLLGADGASRVLTSRY